MEDYGLVWTEITMASPLYVGMVTAVSLPQSTPQKLTCCCQSAKVSIVAAQMYEFSYTEKSPKLCGRNPGVI